MASDTPFIRGAEKLGKRIATIRSNLAIPPMVEEIATLLLKRTLERFDRQLTPDYEPWAALMPETLRRKQYIQGGNAKSLVREGSLRAAIHIIRGRADSGIFTNTGGGLRIGITVPEIAKYAALQNRGNKHITSRRFLGIGELDVKAVDSLLRRKASSLESSL